MYGHSLGGITAIECSRTMKTDSGEPKFKACVALDPYYMGKLSKIMQNDDYKVEQPLLVVTSQTFKDSPVTRDYYDNEETTAKFLQNCRGGNKANPNVQDIAWKNTGHMNQMDTWVHSPVIARLLNFMGPINEAVERAHELSKMVITFMDKHEMLPVKLPQKEKKNNS